MSPVYQAFEKKTATMSSPTAVVERHRADHTHHLGPAHHFALLNHSQVYERLREWLQHPAGEGETRPASGLTLT